MNSTRRLRLRVFLTSLLCMATCLRADNAAFSGAASPDFQQVLKPRAWAFPKDHGRHDGFKTEWWYFTGNLRDRAGRQFGYQLTFFRTAIAPHPATRPSAWAMGELYFAHAAISDIEDKRFDFKDRLQRGRAGLAASSDETMNVFLLDWSARLDKEGQSHLVAKEPGFEIDLVADAGVGPVLQGPGGVNAKGLNPGQASYYYSEPRMPTRGSLTVNGKKFEVQGLSWMDHEFSSNALSNDQSGWDWIALTFDDGTNLMIYRLRNRTGGTDYLSGTQIGTDGHPKYLTSQQISLESSAPWKSGETGAAYPQVWRVAVAGSPAIVVRALMPGQELVTKNSTDVNYFEGAVEAVDEAGKAVGEGYLEMTGYAKPLTGDKK